MALVYTKEIRGSSAFDKEHSIPAVSILRNTIAIGGQPRGEVVDLSLQPIAWTVQVKKNNNKNNISVEREPYRNMVMAVSKLSMKL